MILAENRKALTRGAIGEEEGPCKIRTKKPEPDPAIAE
jgi:hypothetical protein